MGQLEESAMWARLLNCDPFDIVTHAKIHILHHDCKGDIDRHDYTALDILADKQKELL